jgi:hypothetical protein
VYGFRPSMDSCAAATSWAKSGGANAPATAPIQGRAPADSTTINVAAAVAINEVRSVKRLTFGAKKIPCERGSRQTGNIRMDPSANAYANSCDMTIRSRRPNTARPANVPGLH